MDYNVDLPVFRGPLDLLLYLVKRNEVDVCDIAIARVAEQFLDYLGVIQQIDVEWAGDVLVTAATLMEIKSKLLLPPSAAGTAEAPLHVPMERILQRLAERAPATLTELFTPPHTRGRLLGLFLATLELIKGQRVVVAQPEAFGEIWVHLAPPEPGAGAG